jgi:hypothetical protein
MEPSSALEQGSMRQSVLKIEAPQAHEKFEPSINWRCHCLKKMATLTLPVCEASSTGQYVGTAQSHLLLLLVVSISSFG